MLMETFSLHNFWGVCQIVQLIIWLGVILPAETQTEQGEGGPTWVWLCQNCSWWVWRCMAKPLHVAARSVIFCASIGSVGWFRPNAARSQHAGSVRGKWLSTWRAAHRARFPHFVSGLRSGKNHPMLQMKWSALIPLWHARIGHKYPNLANCYFNKFVLK